jgi:hypothetical protein
MQGCKLVGDDSGGFLLTFQSLLGVQLMEQQPPAAAAAAGADGSAVEMCGRLVMLPEGADGVNAGTQSDFKLQLVRDMGESTHTLRDLWMHREVSNSV